jgi:hypothetical protein
MRFHPLVLPVLAALVAFRLQAAVTMSPVIVFTGSGYLYDYTATNTELLPLLGVEMIVPVTPLSTAAPAGWFTAHVAFQNAVLVQWIADVQAIPTVSLEPGH